MSSILHLPPLASRLGILVNPNIQCNGNKAAYNGTYYTYINVQCLHKIHQEEKDASMRMDSKGGAQARRGGVTSKPTFTFSLMYSQCEVRRCSCTVLLEYKNRLQ